MDEPRPVPTVAVNEFDHYRDELRKSHRGLVRRFGGTSTVSKCLVHLSARIVNLFDDVTRTKVSHVDCPMVSVYSRMQLEPNEQMLMTLILEFDILEQTMQEMFTAKTAVDISMLQEALSPTRISPAKNTPHPSSSTLDVSIPMPALKNSSAEKQTSTRQPVMTKKAPLRLSSKESNIIEKVLQEIANTQTMVEIELLSPSDIPSSWAMEERYPIPDSLPVPRKSRKSKMRSEKTKQVPEARHETDPTPPKRSHSGTHKIYQDCVPSGSNGVTDVLEPIFNVPLNVNVDVKEEDADWGTMEVPNREDYEIEEYEDTSRNLMNEPNIITTSPFDVVRKVMGGKAVSCPYCKYFFNAERLDTHIKKKHQPALPLFSCSSCSVSHETVASIVNHFSTICQSGRLIVKKIGDLSQYNSVNIAQAKRGMRSDQARTCPFCGKKQKSYSDLNRHLMENHGTDMRPVYGCSVCGNSELTVNALFNHFIQAKCKGQLALIRMEPAEEQFEAPLIIEEQRVWNNGEEAEETSITVDHGILNDEVKPTEIDFAAYENEIFGNEEISSDDDDMPLIHHKVKEENS